ncbi:hypothetical protein [Tumebacillus permanentifrigoris]|uniref:Uncharacterized protein n=1 Tax=Tumebacillus permanentifrigoris TaxID=378543 RepID=A0A316D4Z6_9BACL|nr:hypothetical protein [Tumebacillus permanentifrigoris]PWK07044.1 hypothetical protein C7459_118120 [Tumebacillus permanentifrigoris]
MGIFDQRIQEVCVIGRELVTISWTEQDLDEEKVFKLSGLLLTNDTALVICDGNVEFHIVEQKADGEFLPIRCCDPIFHIGEEDAKYLQVLDDLSKLSVVEFAKKYPHPEYLEQINHEQQ